MKTKQLFFLTLFIFYGLMSFGQCVNCTDPSNFISNNGNGTFTSSNAQAYFWEICEGNATIVGSNTNQSVSVNCTGNYKIKVTRFQNGNCIEACESITCDNPPPNCPDNIYYINEGGGGLCTTGLASISGLSNVDYVNWTWALGGYSGTINNAGTTTPIYYPSGDWTNYYISICATVVFNDGTVCAKVCKSFLLNCGIGVGNPIKRTSIYPNPSKNGLFSIKQLDDKKEILEINISNSSGVVIKSIKGSNFNLSKEKNGIYFIKVEFKDGSSEVQKVILDK